MKYACSTISKYIKKAKYWLNHFKAINPHDLTVSISKGNRKIGKVMNVSLLPIITCGKCKQCKQFCYDIKACLQYLNVIKARARNTAILFNDRDYYFSEIEKAIARRKTNKFFRWHVSGEIVDLDYFCRMVEIAKNHNDFVFWTYTKMYSIINDYCGKYGKETIPENLKVMFSKWDGLEMDNPFNFPVFAVRMENGNIDYIPFESFYKCSGNCDICKALNRGCIRGENTFTDEH